MTVERRQELILGVMALLWGVILLLPGDTFANVRRYEPLRYVLPDWAWGILLLTCGLFCLLAYPASARKAAHMWLSFIWLFISILAVIDRLTIPSLLIALPFVAIMMLHLVIYFSLPNGNRDMKHAT